MSRFRQAATPWMRSGELATKSRDGVLGRWYELVLAGDGDEQLARERVFAALPLAIKLARYPSLN